MQRRGRNSNSNSNNNFDAEIIGPDHHGHGSIYHHLSSSLSSSPHPRIWREQQPASAAMYKRISVAHLVIIVLFVVLIVEFTSYRLLSSPNLVDIGKEGTKKLRQNSFHFNIKGGLVGVDDAGNFPETIRTSVAKLLRKLRMHDAADELLGMYIDLNGEGVVLMANDILKVVMMIG